MKLLLTSAWNPTIAQATAALEERRHRLVNSIRFYGEGERFEAIVLLDATIDEVSSERLSAILPGKLTVMRVSTSPQGTYAGPSYLESLLYVAARKLFEELPAHEHLFKISGGYIVRNIDDVIANYSAHRLDALGYVHQNPLRLVPRYAMTSCMAMSADHWQCFVNSLPALHDELRSTPLESIYRQFLTAIGARRGIGMPYPRLQARFATARSSTDALPYRLREAAWRLHSRTGLFVLASRSPTSAP